MAIFSNQATLTYNGNTTNSNIAYGEILDVLTASKTSVEGIYTQNGLVTYVITLRNTGNAALNGLSVSDNLGGYDFGGTTLYPLTYSDGSATLFIDGVLQPDPAVAPGPPLVISGINIPGGSDAVLIYQARANQYAPPTADGVITNTATITGDGLSAPVIATETVNSATTPILTISKSITPSQVVDNDRVTYTFVIQNSGNQAVVATDNAAISDVFDPILNPITVTLNGTPIAEGTGYSYDTTGGIFATTPGAITVPAATLVQDPVTGEWNVTPGTAVLVVTGTVSG